MKAKKLRPQASLPARATQHSAGYDLRACVDEPVTIPAGERITVPTGIAVDLEDPKLCGLIFGRSGLGIKYGIVPANAVGVIDADYRGEIMVGLQNHSRNNYIIQPGERIAQLVVVPILTPSVEECEELSYTDRGEGGFGSSGRV